MQHWQETLPFDFSHPIINETFTETSLFFDIETTGFSPARTSLYLIGCAARQGDNLIVDQFFADSPEEEQEVLTAFFTYLEHFQTVITFNGIGFDIPYLKSKCSTYGLCEPFSSHEYLDIYKVISKLKFLLHLPNLKQKTIEQFLGIGREDTYNGGELIEVYQSYVRSRSPKDLHLLKQHNYEDVIDMPNLLPVLSYAKIFEGNFSVASLMANQFTSYAGPVEKELIFTLKHDLVLPAAVSCRHEDFYLTARGGATRLVVRLFTGELKYFYSDYKNYFYLPKEDMAVPKALGSGVEKGERVKATASTCYRRKTAIFLPQYAPVIRPAFRAMYKDKKSYFELSEEFVSSREMQKEYVEHVLGYLKEHK